MSASMPFGEPWPYPVTPWIPQPTWPYPQVYPTIKTITTTSSNVLCIEKRDRRIKELEALLMLAHDELMEGDDDALAVCELIEESVELEERT